MNKLLMSIGMASLICGVRAETTVVSAENFDSLTAGDSLTIASPWSTEDTEGAFTVVAEAAGGNSLAVDSADKTKPLYFGDKELQADAANVLIDAMVTFAPYADEDPSLVEGAKILLWPKQNEATGKTDLWATVGKPTEGGAPEAVKVCLKTGVDTEGWHHVVVTSVGPLFDAEVVEEGLAPQILGFTITVDDETMQVSGGDLYEYFNDPAYWSESVRPYLTVNEFDVITGGRVFPSLVTDAMTVTSIGFSGAGSVDELSISTEGGEETDWPAVDTLTDSDTPAAKGITVPAELANVSLKRIVLWAKANGVAFEAAAEINVEAFLLNCAPTEDAVRAAKAAFRFAEIKPGVVPTISGDYNGKVVVTAGADPTCETPAAEDAKAVFYKANLVADEVDAKAE